MTDHAVPKGYKFSAIAAGFRKKDRKDLALAVSETPATVAACFTTALFKAAPVLVGQEILAEGSPCRAVLINSGQANACTGEQGMDNCRRSMELVAAAAGLNAREVLPASTGVIGAQLKMDLWEKAAPSLAAALGHCSHKDFAGAIMTTDRFPKIASATAALAAGSVTLMGVAKGAGMICPNMATMLSVLFCDAAVERGLWQKLVRLAVEASFNRASVDGDTSTNDTLYALANGASGVRAEESDAEALLTALTEVLQKLAYMLVRDGEGATKVMRISVTGAPTDADAEKAARTVGHSLLVKTAMFGQDPNWGRIIAALGRSGASFNPDEVVLAIAGLEIFKRSTPLYNSDPPEIVEALKHTDIPIHLSLGAGPGTYDLLASDLGHDYVTLNSDYRS